MAKVFSCGYTENALQSRGNSEGIVGAASDLEFLTLRVQVPNNHILTQNLYYNYYYPNPKYLIIGYMDTLG